MLFLPSIHVKIGEMVECCNCLVLLMKSLIFQRGCAEELRHGTFGQQRPAEGSPGPLLSSFGLFLLCWEISRYEIQKEKCKVMGRCPLSAGASRLLWMMSPVCPIHRPLLLCVSVPAELTSRSSWDWFTRRRERLWKSVSVSLTPLELVWCPHVMDTVQAWRVRIISGKWSFIFHLFSTQKNDSNVSLSEWQHSCLMCSCAGYQVPALEMCKGWK